MTLCLILHPVTFDDLLRQGQRVSAQGETQRQVQQEKESKERSDLEEWRESLREFGRWFAAEASARRLPTLPLVTHAEQSPAPPPKVNPWQRMKRQAGKAEPVAAPPSVARSGWAILPLHPGSGEVWRGVDPVKYGGRWNYDDYVDYKWAYLCLAVAVDGQVNVGLLQHDRVMLTWSVHGRNHDIIGRGPDTLTPSKLLYRVAQMNYEVPLYMSNSEYPEENRRNWELNDSLSREVLSFYVAHAQQMLQKR